MAVVLAKMVSGGVTVGTASTAILPANSRRQYAEIVNSSDQGIWIKFGEDAVVGQGVYIAAGGFSYEMGQDNLYRGAVNGICVSGGKVVGTLEGS